MGTNETNENVTNAAMNAADETVANAPAPKKNHGGAWKAVLAVVLTAGVVGSTTLSAFNLATLKSYVASQQEDQNEETTEDYVKIAEQYEIKPTTNISDAYKSGDTSKLTDKEKETLDMAKDALKEMKIKDDMSDFEKEKAVYDWMTSSLQHDQGALTVIPTTQEDCDNPYGVLKYHNAVCVGYATTFRMFMQMLDIECMVEHNNEKYHSWDVVKIDGDWYITDIYSDAGNGNYAHFNMTNNMWSQEQSWDQEFFPVANSLKYNMAYQNKQTVDSVYDIPKALRKAMDKQQGSLMIAFKEKIDDEKAQIANAAVSSVSDMLMNNNYKDMPYAINTYSWVTDPDSGDYLYSITFSSYNTNNNTQNLTDDQLQKINDAVTKAMEGLQTGAYDEQGNLTYDNGMDNTMNDGSEGKNAMGAEDVTETTMTMSDDGAIATFTTGE